MIFFGTRTKSLQSDSSYTFDCPSCNSKNTVYSGRLIKYFHIFWIPTFVYSDQVYTICTHCKNFRYQKEIPCSEQVEIKSRGFPRKSLGYYSGAIILALLVFAIILSVMNNNLNKNKYLSEPEVNDTYTIRSKNGKETYYTLYRVVEVSRDSVLFEINDYEVTNVSQVRKLREDYKNSYTEKIKLSINDLQKMDDDNSIRRIDR